MAAVPASQTRGPAGTRFRTIEWFDAIDSTNTHLVARARNGAPDGLVAVADEQHAGRGRLGRTWWSPPGGSLLVSVLLRPTVAIDRWPLLASAAGVAAAETLVALGDVPAQLKWPNDVLVRGRKIAGLLAEAEPAAGAVVVGMGMNLRWTERPPELESIATAVSLESARAVDRVAVLDGWLRRLDSWLHAVEHDPTAPARLRFAHRQRSATTGARVRVELPQGELVGTALDVDEHGHLMVQRDDGAISTVEAGDVVHVRPTLATDAAP
jgi:BirA family biotin operon repressor/biotin-[acetyl-CoA-carboxylase] ligase